MENIFSFVDYMLSLSICWKYVGTNIWTYFQICYNIVWKLTLVKNTSEANSNTNMLNNPPDNKGEVWDNRYQTIQNLYDFFDLFFQREFFYIQSYLHMPCIVLSNHRA